MTYLKLDVGFPWHPRLAPLSDRAFRVHVIALCHSKAYMTDGYIEWRLARSWGAGATTLALKQLIASGLWECVTRDDKHGYQIHDWLDYNSSAAESSAKRSEAGRRGGLVSARVSRVD